MTVNINVKKQFLTFAETEGKVTKVLEPDFIQIFQAVQKLIRVCLQTKGQDHSSMRSIVSEFNNIVIFSQPIKSCSCSSEAQFPKLWQLMNTDRNNSWAVSMFRFGLNEEGEQFRKVTPVWCQGTNAWTGSKTTSLIVSWDQTPYQWGGISLVTMCTC
jgi:hypothetical protein